MASRTINARFYVAEVGPRYAGQTGGRVVLRAVVRSTDDNVDWSKYTPSGTLEMMVTQDAVFDTFEENRGKDVLLTMAFADDGE